MLDKTSKTARWAVVLTVICIGVVLSLNITINDNALDLLPGKAVKGDLQKLQDMGLVNRLFITLSVDPKYYQSDEQAQFALQESATKLGETLASSALFSNVMASLPRWYELSLFGSLHSYLPQLLDVNDLSAISERLTSEALEGVMQDNFTLLNSPAGIGLKKQLQKDPLGFTSLLLTKLGHLRSEFSMSLQDGFFMSEDGLHCMVLAESKETLTDSSVAEEIEYELQKAYKLSLVEGVEARVIGSLPHTLANSRIIKQDLSILLPVASILFVILLGATLRSFKALIVFSVPFLAAPFAIGVTSLIFGQISALALGFGIALLGIAVDFSVHIYLALERECGTPSEILIRLRKPIVFATLTTSGVFSVLFLSEVTSHNQMATLAFVGVLIAVCLAWIIIPMIVQKKSVEHNIQPNPTVTQNKTLSPRITSIAMMFWALLLVAGVLTWPKLEYNGDLRVLDVPDDKVMVDEEFFEQVWGSKGEQVFVISEGNSLAEALDLNSKIYGFLKNTSFTDFQSIAPILPGEKVQRQNQKQWDEFWSARKIGFKEQFNIAAQNQGFTERAFLPFYKWLDKETQLLRPEELMDGTLAPMLSTMLNSTSGKDGGTEGGDQTLILTTVSLKGGSLSELNDFASTYPNISVIANSKWRGEVEELLKKDILFLSLLAGAMVVFLVAFQFKRTDAIIAVLAPVLSALSAMSLFCWFTGSQLNMMHVIMSIMVIGLSVDYGIFIVCSKLDGENSVSALAVSVCAASSLIGFGVLSFAQHPALHALGITVLVGIGAAWPVALYVSPTFLKKAQR